jgi:hypothetical protein
MTNNTKQGLIVIGLTIGLLFVAAFLLTRRAGIQEHKMVDMAVSNSMVRSYRDLVASGTNLATSQSAQVNSADLWRAFCDAERGTLKGPSLPPPEGIFLAKEPVKIGSPMLLCAAQGPDSVYGINAAGVFRPLTNGELNSWPHISAKNFMTNR